jgi:hypothetical protein
MKTSSVDDEAERRQMLSLLMPTKIEIVKPFTRVKSFDADADPDGIEMMVRAINALDNPGLMIVGQVRVQLSEYMPGSAEERGRLLENWDIDLSTAQRQKSYWNALTQMYEFRLGIDPSVIPAAEKYVLTVTYRSPLGEHLADQCLIEYRATTGPLGGVRARSP